MQKNVHVIPHTHWDREWYFTTSRSKVYLLKDLKDILDNLESNQGYDRFVLDGQASLIEDYLKWCPKDEKRIAKLVREKKLIIGPWYTQTDQFVISGESIVKNLKMGIDICSRFGNYMNVGYVPDSFGQESSMPQIYKQFGINDAFFWRGVSDEEVKHTEYIWKGEDGTKINVYQIPYGYYIGGIVDETKLNKILSEFPFDRVIKTSTTTNVAFPNGFDQAPPRKNLPELISKLNQANPDYNFKISSIEEYIAAVKKELPDNLEEISGELTNGKNMRIHKSIYSSRSDLKKMNTELQFYLVNILEPILSMGDRLGIEYPKEVVADIWKLMFENAAHDSIGSCVSDTTNEDVYMRYKQVRDISESLAELTMRQICTRIKDTSENPISITVFNTLPFIRNVFTTQTLYVPSEEFDIFDENGNKIDYIIESIEDTTDYILSQTIQLNPGEKIYIPEKVYTVKVGMLIPNIPASGYSRLYIREGNNKAKRLTKSEDRFIENDFYKIRVESCGSVEITQKQTGNIYKNQAVLVENGDDGDSFNYSPAKKDWVIKSTNQNYNVEVNKTNLKSILKIKYDFILPKNLEQRANKKANIHMPVELFIELNKKSDVINFRVKVDNRFVDSHRLCVDFDTDIVSNVSIADQQFGVLQRPVYRTKEMNSWLKNPNDWNEKPISIETCQSFVALANNEQTCAVFPKGVREYEIIGKNYDIIRLTLFRTYGMMGKENLLYRPGRASGEKVIATPDAQLHQEMCFEFGLFIGKNNFDQNNVSQKAKEYTTPVQLYEYSEFLNGRLIFNLDKETNIDLDQNTSLFRLEGAAVLSTFKKADAKPGYVIRIYNGNLNGVINEKIIFGAIPKIAQIVNLKEERISDLEINCNTISLENIGHAKFVTIYFEY